MTLTCGRCGEPAVARVEAVDAYTGRLEAEVVDGYRSCRAEGRDPQHVLIYVHEWGDDS